MRHRVIYGIIILMVCIIGVKVLASSLFFSGKERINIVMYGKETTFISLGIRDNLDYAIPFYPDLQVQVPGGYGYYRIGALGKLVSLEKQPDILRKTFSLTTSTFVDYYFYPESSEIYYGKTATDRPRAPSLRAMFFNKSNASWLDKLYLYWQMIGRSSPEFTVFKNVQSKNKDGDRIFSFKEFTKAYQGYFYQRIYRSEKKNIQIEYVSSWETADILAFLLEGNGVRVADVTQGKGGIKGCIIKEYSDTFSQTARDVALFFNCQLRRDKTGIYDILFILGSREKEWEIGES